MSVRGLLTNAAWSALAHVLGRGGLVLASILLARSLDTPGFAAYSYFQVTVSMLSAYAAMGMGVAATRFFAESDHGAGARDQLLGTLWVLSILAGLLVATVVICVPSAWLDTGLDVPRWLLAVGVLSMSLGVVPGGAVLGLERFAASTVTAAAAGLVLVFGATVAGRSGSALAAMSWMVVATLVQAVGDSWIVLRRIGWGRIFARFCFGHAELRAIIVFAGPTVGVTLLAASGSWLVGRIILSGPSGDRGFALYAIGLQWLSFALLLPAMVTRVVLPRMVKVRLNCTSSSPEAGKLLVQRGSLITVLLAVLTCGIGVVLSPWVLKLYGTSYALDKWLIAGFMLAAIPSAPANTLGNAIVADNGQLTWLGLTLIWLLFMVAVAYMSLAMGAWGGALAHGFAAMMLSALSFAIARKRRLV